MPSSIDPDQWYWDRRTNKAYRAVEQADGTVTMLTVWHEDEVDGAIESGALSPLDEIAFGDTDTFDLVDSFRLPELAGEDAGGES